MPIIEPASPEQLDTKKLTKMREQARELGVPDENFFEILGHAPNYAESLFDAMYRAHALGSVDHKLKEIMRIQLARLAKDPYFSALRSKPAREAGLTEDDIDAGDGAFENDDRFSDADKWALRYAWLMYREPKKVDAEFHKLGHTYYTEAQITELGSFIALHYGIQVFFRTLSIIPKG